MRNNHHTGEEIRSKHNRLRALRNQLLMSNEKDKEKINLRIKDTENEIKELQKDREIENDKNRINVLKSELKTARAINDSNRIEKIKNEIKSLEKE